MATTAKSIVPVMSKAKSHTYHAEADVLSGHLLQPVNQEINPQALVKLNDLRGAHLFQRAERYSLEGLISFKSGYTRVSGSRSLETEGWTTLATAVIEGLNVFDVITADRMVAQITTEHPVENGHVPHVTFLGTNFENLRVGGYKVEVELDLGICGAKPEGDQLYTSDRGFLSRATGQLAVIARASGLPSEVQPEYDGEVVCSLVTSIAHPSIPGVKSFGNILEIAGFGVVSLADLQVGAKVYDPSDRPSTYFDLTMLKIQLGHSIRTKAKARTEIKAETDSGPAANLILNTSAGSPPSPTAAGATVTVNGTNHP